MSCVNVLSDSFSFRVEGYMPKLRCPHLRENQIGHTELIHRLPEGSPSRSELHTETQLCAICSAKLANFMQRLERGEE